MNKPVATQHGQITYEFIWKQLTAIEFNMKSSLSKYFLSLLNADPTKVPLKNKDLSKAILKFILSEV